MMIDVFTKDFKLLSILLFIEMLCIKTIIFKDRNLLARDDFIFHIS